VNVATELKDSADFTAPVFRFLSRTILLIGFLSLALLFTVPPNQRITVVWFAALTIAVGGGLRFVRGAATPETALLDGHGIASNSRVE
jgi:hypothetical protein